jgi:pyruvate/2-oxoglutarate dehydrogenase complex dihydrolipoamide acyltransferase (E2) component
MTTEVKVPTLGENLTTMRIVRWHRSDGQTVNVGDELLDVDSDKATLTVIAETPGTLRTIFPAGVEVHADDVVATIDARRGRFVAEWVGDSPSFVDGLAAAYNRLDVEGYDVVNVVAINGWELVEQPSTQTDLSMTATKTEGLIVVGQARENSSGEALPATRPATEPSPVSPTQPGASDTYQPPPFAPSHAAHLM